MNKRKLSSRIGEYVDLVLHIRLLKQILSEGGYLFETGWKQSQWNKDYKVMDHDGNSIPWLTYPFLNFIEPRLNKNMEVFEYGVGYSSVWWAKKCKGLTAVESSQEWIDLVKNSLSADDKLSIFYADEKVSFCTAPERTNKKYDIVIVDQADDMDRNLAMQNAINYLSDDGVLILDDSEREKYNIGKQYLFQNGFKELEFMGLASTISYYGKKTSVFYRMKNVLKI